MISYSYDVLAKQVSAFSFKNVIYTDSLLYNMDSEPMALGAIS